MRLFIGIELPDAVKASLGKTVDRVRSRISRTAPKSSIRWIDPANLHITLWFLGEVDDGLRERVVEGMQEAASRVPRFELQFGEPGSFPSSGAPRVIWIGIKAGGAGLARLYKTLEEPLGALGFEAEKRPYSAHLTIGRVKDVRKSDVALVRSALAESAGAIGCDISAVTLFRSKLSPKGANYESLLRVPLA